MFGLFKKKKESKDSFIKVNLSEDGYVTFSFEFNNNEDNLLGLVLSVYLNSFQSQFLDSFSKFVQANPKFSSVLNQVLAYVNEQTKSSFILPTEVFNVQN